MRKLMSSTLVIALLGLLGFTTISWATGSNYGAIGSQTKETFTLEEMLTYAIQDEYLAKAEYIKIMEKFGSQNPFSNIEVSEERHIAMLMPLFSKYNVPVPADTSSEHVIIPDTLLDAYKAGVQAEINNIGMYEKFLRQTLPEDVRNVFLNLKYASQNHQNAFENKVAQMEGGSTGGGGGGGKGGGKGGGSGKGGCH